MERNQILRHELHKIEQLLRCLTSEGPIWPHFGQTVWSAEGLSLSAFGAQGLAVTSQGGLLNIPPGRSEELLLWRKGAVQNMHENHLEKVRFGCFYVQVCV